MRRKILAGLVLALILNLANPGYCDGPFRKFGRGVSNLLTCPMEIPNRISQVNKRSGPYEAATYGLWEGACMVLIRAAAGFYEVATFPIPIPEKYEPMLKDPEFFFGNHEKQDNEVRDAGKDL